MRAGRLLLYARQKARLSQRELGRRAGVTQAAIARIEQAKASPRLETFERLLAACGFELEVVPTAGVGIDRTVMAHLMTLAPAERARLAAREARAVDELLRLAKR